MKTKNRKSLIMVGLLCSVVLLLGSGGVIYVISTNNVSNDNSGERWEPSSAAGTTWATSWQEFIEGASYVATWDGSGWSSRQALTAPNSSGSIDVNLAWDASRNHFVFVTVAKDFSSLAYNVWYGWSDNSGSSWTFGSTPIFTGSFGQVLWDYPSVGIDASGRIIVGAVKLAPRDNPPCPQQGQTCPVGYYTAVSTDGVNFSVPSCVAGVSCSNLGPGSAPGSQSRVVAAGNLFEAFIPTLALQPDTSFLPTLIQRYESSDGVNWSGPMSIGMDSFAMPNNNTPPGFSPVLFYAPLLAASGYTNGLWSVAFQANQNGWNNVILCTSDRGCSFVNYANDDEFLAGTSVSGDSGYWVSYLAYSSLDTRELPLISQSLYFPPGQPPIYVNYPGIYTTGWTSSSGRCPNAPGCLGAGDFATIASNPYAGASTPFVMRSVSNPNVLFQNFLQDPPAPPNFKDSRPNVVPIAFGADITALGKPVPLEAWGLNPALRHQKGH